MATPEKNTASNVPEISTESWQRCDEDPALSVALAAVLPSRRWYRDKTRTISSSRIGEVVPVTGTDAYLTILELTYAEGDPQIYLLAVGLAKEGVAHRIEAEHPETILIRLVSSTGQPSGFLYDAFFNQTFATALLTAIAQGKCVKGKNGDFVASHTRAFDRIRGPAKLDLKAKVSRVEQSNTSIIYEDRFILKVFRKLEEGINPDIEIGIFLTESEFTHSPAVAGLIEYKAAQGGSSYVGILQQFVRNQGDAWKYTLDSLADFFRSAQSHDPAPSLDSYHPLNLPDQDPRQLQDIGPYLESAASLGARTAQMHAALTDRDAGPDFVPESFTAKDQEELHRSLLEQADTTLRLLRQEKSKLSPEALEIAEKVLKAEPQIRKKLDAIANAGITAMRIRHHGDYHLGQVLYTGSDFMIIDYEGEPSRSLAERRRKSLAMRDVAGMIRSFQYAAYAALFTSDTEERTPNLESYAALWTALVSAAFLKSYFDVAGRSAFLPQSAEELRLLFDVFLLQKALYEVAYELNNRPDWVTIPLRGILTLLD